jgi:hypothetical protein
VLHWTKPNIICRQKDNRTRYDRIQRQVDCWSTQLPGLVSAYLEWSAHGPPTRTDEELWDMRVLTMEGKRVTFQGYNTYYLLLDNSIQQFHHFFGSETINISLARYGVLGSAPEKPSLAFSFRTLESYRQLHRVCPRLSIDAFSKALHHLYQVRNNNWRHRVI